MSIRKPMVQDTMGSDPTVGDREFIKHHINQFRLKDSKYRKRALAEFMEDVIEADGKYRKEKEYSNYISK